MPTGPGAFGHQHGDPRNLAERIEAQLRERIEEAMEMAALELMVGVRAESRTPRAGRRTTRRTARNG